MSLSGCLSAALLARHFRDRGRVPAEALKALQDAPADVVCELPTGELQALAEVVFEERHRRVVGSDRSATATRVSAPTALGGLG